MTAIKNSRQKIRPGSLYKVKKGDSLWSIATGAYGNGFLWEHIKKANHMRKWDSKMTIFIGEELQVPVLNPTSHNQSVPQNQKLQVGQLKTKAEALSVLYPALKVEDTVVILFKEKRCGMETKVELTGELIVQKKGTIGDLCTFNLTNYASTCRNEITGFLGKTEQSIIVDAVGEVSMRFSNVASNTLWESSFSISTSSEHLETSFEIKPKPITIEQGDLVVTGEMGMNVSVKASSKDALQCQPLARPLPSYNIQKRKEYLSIPPYRPIIVRNLIIVVASGAAAIIGTTIFAPKLALAASFIIAMKALPNLFPQKNNYRHEL